MTFGKSTLGEELLTPTRIYVKPVLSVLSAFRGKSSVIKGIAHITGGAFYDKIARILPDKVNVVINKSAWGVPKIFRLIQNKGVFNVRRKFSGEVPSAYQCQSICVDKIMIDK